MITRATRACAGCILRFAAYDCPECGQSETMSMDAPDGRRRVFAALRAIHGKSSRLPWLVQIGVVDEDWAPVVPLRLHLPRPSAERACLRGTVRAIRTLASSPRERECVVFGVRGEIEGAVIADATAVDFELELGSGERVAIESEHTMFDSTEPRRPRRREGRDDALEAFLERRGVARLHALMDSARPRALEEHRIEEGDEVTVDGEIDWVERDAKTYRSPAHGRLLRGTALEPLRIARA